MNVQQGSNKHGALSAIHRPIVTHELAAAAAIGGDDDDRPEATQAAGRRGAVLGCFAAPASITSSPRRRLVAAICVGGSASV